MGARGFCVGIGSFLTFSAMVLMILVNIGQISENRVARAFWLTEVSTTGVQLGGGANNVLAADQGAPLLQNNGLRDNYYWGMYSVCGGDGVSGPRACDKNMFGHRFLPATVLEEEVPQGVDVQGLLPQGTFRDNEYLGKFTHAAFYLLFIGTILAGLAFIIAFLSQRFAFLLAALASLGAAACLAVGAAIWTAIITKARDSLRESATGLAMEYGRSLWMTWASFGACAVAFPFLVISCCVGRDKYDRY